MPLWKKKKKPKKKSVSKPKPKPQQALAPVQAKPKFEPKPFVPPKIPEYFTPPLKQAVDTEKEFLKAFKSLTYKHRAWDVWNDFIVMAACSLSNPVDKLHYEERESRYLLTSAPWSVNPADTPRRHTSRRTRPLRW